MARRNNDKKTVIKKVVKMPKFAEDKIKKKLIEENEVIKKDNEEASLELRQTEEKKTSLDNDIKSIGNVFDSRKKELEETKLKHNTITKEIKDLEILLSSSKEQQEKELNADIAQLASTKTSLESDIVGLKKDIAVLCLDKEVLEINEERLKKLITTDEKHLEDVKQNTLNKKNELHAIEGHIKRYSDTLEKKEHENEKLDTKIINLHVLLEIERQKLVKTKQDNDNKQQELVGKNKSLEDIQKRMFGFLKREKRVNEIIPELKKLASEAGYNITI